MQWHLDGQFYGGEHNHAVMVLFVSVTELVNRRPLIERRVRYESYNSFETFFNLCSLNYLSVLISIDREENQTPRRKSLKAQDSHELLWLFSVVSQRHSTCYSLYGDDTVIDTAMVMALVVIKNIIVMIIMGYDVMDNSTYFGPKSCSFDCSFACRSL